MDTPMAPRPDARDPGCAEVRDLLGAYHDGELAPEQMASVARHLVGCADCARTLEELGRASARLREQFPPLAAPDVLRARVRAALRDASNEAAPVRAFVAPPRSRSGWWMRQAAAGVAIAALSSGLTLVAVRRREPITNQASHAVVESHVRALMTNHLTDVLSTDQHTVKPWFNGKVDFSPEVQRLDDTGFPLIGGRVDSVAARAVAALVYGRRKHVIDVYTWPAATADSAAAAPSSSAGERGYNSIHWRHDGMEFWAVSDLNAAELRQFVDAFRGGDVH
jgi:anti-sigma factor RsiW